MHKWISVRQAAEMVGVSKFTIRDLIHKGELPAWRIPGTAENRHFRIREEDVRRLFELEEA